MHHSKNDKQNIYQSKEKCKRCFSASISVLTRKQKQKQKKSSPQNNKNKTKCKLLCMTSD